MIGKLIGAATGAAINKEQHGNPIVGAVVGFASMALARRFLPARVAVLGATLGAGYVTKKLADRAARREDARQHADKVRPGGVADNFAILNEDGEELETHAAQKAIANGARRTPQAIAPRSPRESEQQTAERIDVPHPVT